MEIDVVPGQMDWGERYSRINVHQHNQRTGHPPSSGKASRLSATPGTPSARRKIWQFSAKFQSWHYIVTVWRDNGLLSPRGKLQVSRRVSRETRQWFVCEVDLTPQSLVEVPRAVLSLHEPVRSVITYYHLLALATPVRFHVLLADIVCAV